MLLAGLWKCDFIEGQQFITQWLVFPRIFSVVLRIFQTEKLDFEERPSQSYSKVAGWNKYIWKSNTDFYEQELPQPELI